MRKRICLITVIAVFGTGVYAVAASADISVDAPKTQVFRSGDQLSTSFTVFDTLVSDTCTLNGTFTFPVSVSANTGTSVTFADRNAFRSSNTLVCGGGTATWTTTYVFAGPLG